MKVVIAGAHGVLGHALAERLSRDHELVLLDVKRRGPTSGVVRADIRDWHDVRAVLDRTGPVDAAINVATSPWVRHYEIAAALAFEIHTLGSWTLFDECERHGAGRLLLASSINAYGDMETGEVLLEDDDLVQRVSIDRNYPYGLAKLYGELTLRHICETRGCSGVAYRLGALHVPGVVEPRGIHVDDAVDGFRRGLEVDLEGFAVVNLTGSPERYNVPTDRAETLLAWTPQHPFEPKPELEHWRRERTSKMRPRATGARHVVRQKIGGTVNRVSPHAFRWARRVFRAGR